MNKEKGFTLVELLVTVIILGMITALSFPVLRRLRSNSEHNRFENYRVSLESVAKTYVDAYEADVFSSTSCNYITYEMLDRKKYFRDISIDGVTCKSSGTFIKVSRDKGIYKYTAYLGCGLKNDADADGVLPDDKITYIFPAANVPYTTSVRCVYSEY